MNLNDFNRYAKDFEKKRKGYGEFVVPVSSLPLSMVNRQAQMMSINQQNQLANMRLMQQQQMAASNMATMVGLTPPWKW